jgi:hypothetical protein
VDKSTTLTTYEIEIDAETGVPVNIHMISMAGYRGTGAAASKTHVAFHFKLDLSKHGEAEKVRVPRGAQSLLR